MFGGNVNPAASAAPAQQAPPAAPMADPNAAGGGDGFHHYTLDQTDMGFHSVHTGPDGTVTEGDPASPEEAASDMQTCMGGEPDGDESMPDATGDSTGASDSAPDFSAAYSK